MFVAELHTHTRAHSVALHSHAFFVRAQEAHHYYGEAEEKPVVSIKAEKGTSQSETLSVVPLLPPPAV